MKTIGALATVLGLIVATAAPSSASESGHHRTAPASHSDTSTYDGARCVTNFVPMKNGAGVRKSVDCEE